ncbi:MAG TPA: MarR family transcriptional regulator [Burkholderiales bacterium]|nr:MarR family transcriptional regulator [Burkholderiales bacterium]
MSKNPDIKAHAWAVLLTAHATLVEKIEAALSGAGLPPLAWYDVLWELEKAEGGRLRMHELARRIVLSRSNLTRLADRLESAKLIVREDAPQDRRGYHCVVTAAGLATRRKMWPLYKAAIERFFSQHVTLEEARALAESLSRAVKAARDS